MKQVQLKLLLCFLLTTCITGQYAGSPLGQSSGGQQLVLGQPSISAWGGLSGPGTFLPHLASKSQIGAGLLGAKTVEAPLATAEATASYGQPVAPQIPASFARPAAIQEVPAAYGQQDIVPEAPRTAVHCHNVPDIPEVAVPVTGSMLKSVDSSYGSSSSANAQALTNIIRSGGSSYGNTNNFAAPAMNTVAKTGGSAYGSSNNYAASAPVKTFHSAGSSYGNTNNFAAPAMNTIAKTSGSSYGSAENFAAPAMNTMAKAAASAYGSSNNYAAPATATLIRSSGSAYGNAESFATPVVPSFIGTSGSALIATPTGQPYGIRSTGEYIAYSEEPVDISHCGPIPAENPCSAYGAQYFSLPNAPSCYIQCAFERAFIRPCPAGLVWNPLISGCDWPTLPSTPSTDVSYGSGSYAGNTNNYGSSSYGASAVSASSAPSYSYGRKKRSAERKKRFLGGFGKPIVSEVPLGPPVPGLIPLPGFPGPIGIPGPLIPPPFLPPFLPPIVPPIGPIPPPILPPPLLPPLGPLVPPIPPIPPLLPPFLPPLFPPLPVPLPGPLLPPLPMSLPATFIPGPPPIFGAPFLPPFGGPFGPLGGPFGGFGGPFGGFGGPFGGFGGHHGDFFDDVFDGDFGFGGGFPFGDDFYGGSPGPFFEPFPFPGGFDTYEGYDDKRGYGKNKGYSKKNSYRKNGNFRPKTKGYGDDYSSYDDDYSKSGRSSYGGDYDYRKKREYGLNVEQQQQPRTMLSQQVPLNQNQLPSLSSGLVSQQPSSVSSYSYAPQTPIAEASVAPKLVKPSLCIGKPNNTNLPYPNDASKYISCLNEEQFEIMDCPTGLIYNGERDQCEKVKNTEKICERNQPCLNDGQCHQTSPSTYKCTCRGAWTGEHCETPLSSCATNPCGEGNECHTLNANDYKQDYVCVCSGKKSYGLSCERNTVQNPCIAAPDDHEQYYPFAFSAHAYVQCNGDLLYVRPCAGGLFWNQEQKICDREPSAPLRSLDQPQSYQVETASKTVPLSTYGSVEQSVDRQQGGRYRNYNPQPTVDTQRESFPQINSRVHLPTTNTYGSSVHTKSQNHRFPMQHDFKSGQQQLTQAQTPVFRPLGKQFYLRTAPFKSTWGQSSMNTPVKSSAYRR